MQLPGQLLIVNQTLICFNFIYISCWGKSWNFQAGLYNEGGIMLSKLGDLSQGGIMLSQLEIAHQAAIKACDYTCAIIICSNFEPSLVFKNHSEGNQWNIAISSFQI